MHLREKNFHKEPSNNIDLPGYIIEQIPTEPSARGALIYISQSLLYKPRKDLELNLKKTGICIY